MIYDQNDRDHFWNSINSLFDSLNTANKKQDEKIKKERDVITIDDVTNLVITLNTNDVNDFIEKL